MMAAPIDDDDDDGLRRLSSQQAEVEGRWREVVCMFTFCSFKRL